jgi:8-oxo-dGTP pyrophosphatase MutT (NUDIX family)
MRMRSDTERSVVFPEYLMVQRKDTICFVEFVRGRYDTEDVMYVGKLFSGMTPEEREMLLTTSFDDIWEYTWQSSRRNLSEYRASKEKFDRLRLADGISHIMQSNVCEMAEPEWEFPKGRKSSGEHGVECALREFEEEGGITRSLVYVHNTPTLVFDKLGCNGTVYRAVYYFATTAVPESLVSPALNSTQAKEVRCVKWFGPADASAKLRHVDHVAKFRELNDFVLKSQEFPRYVRPAPPKPRAPYHGWVDST